MNYAAIASQVAPRFTHADVIDFFTDEDLIFPPSAVNVNNLTPGLVVDSDTFFPPHVIAALLTAGLVTDADTVYGPTAVYTPPVISFVSTASINGGGGTAATGILPGSRLNGNILVAWVQLTTTGNTFSIGGGWVLQDTSADGSCAWATRIVDGTEANAVFTWSGGATWHSQCSLIKNNDASSPIGATNQASGTSTTLTAASLTTTHDGSMTFAILLTAGSQVISVPSGYTDAGQFNDGNGSNRMAYEVEGLSGSTSTAISVTISSALWHSFAFEIKAA